MMKTKKILTVLLGLMLASCASKPQLYPNEAYKRKGKVVAQSEVEICMDEADAFLESSKGKAMVKGAGAGAVIGGAIGAVAGAFTGNIARGAAQGAAMGGAGGAAGGALSPDQVKRNYVNQCLSEKGYHVIGWN